MAKDHTFFIGWDVGGWHCDNNTKSRDAIVILNEQLSIVGNPWRGNLRSAIGGCVSSRDWHSEIFALCGISPPVHLARFIMAIDTPLGFPEALSELIAGNAYAAEVESSVTNPYLFRVTEQYLFEKGLSPLSAVKDMIGSQATKGMHLIAKLGLARVHCGLWVEGDWFAVIETYPAPCRNSALMDELLAPFVRTKKVGHETEWVDPINHRDKADALVCALIAYCFDARHTDLVRPIESAPVSEGWIWLPRDVITNPEAHSAQLGEAVLVSVGARQQ